MDIRLLVRESSEYLLPIPPIGGAIISFLPAPRWGVGRPTLGGLAIATPAASPALIGVGLHHRTPIGRDQLCRWGHSPGSCSFPSSLFLQPRIQLPDSALRQRSTPDLVGPQAFTVWYNIVRPIAVGAMLVGALYTLWGLRDLSGQGACKGALKPAWDWDRIGRGFEAHASRAGPEPPHYVMVAAFLLLIVPITLVYYHFTGNLGGALLAAVIMTLTGFLVLGGRRLAGRAGRRVESADLGTHAFHLDRRGAADGLE